MAAVRRLEPKPGEAILPIGPNGEPLPYPNEPQQSPQQIEAIFDDVFRLLDLIRQHPTTDSQDLVRLEKARTLLQEIPADMDKGLDAAMAGKFDSRMMRKLGGQ